MTKNTTMTAAVYRRFEGPDVVHLEQCVIPSPKPGEVLIRVHASTVSIADHLETRRNDIMTIRTKSPNMLDDPPVSVQAKLAAAWTSLMFLVIYIDYFHLYQPGEIDDIRGGVIFGFDISGTLMSVFFVIIAVPALMILLSMTLPARVNRATNLVVASLYIPIMVFNAAGATWDYAFYYALTIGVEVLILAFILRSAWMWPRTAPVPGSSRKLDERTLGGASSIGSIA